MKLQLSIVCIITALLILAGCNKYEDGPLISLKSPEKRIVGEYIVESYIINDQLIPLSDIGISEYRIVYNKDGSGKTTITSNNYPNESDFEWELDEKKENIRERYKGQNNEWSVWSNYKQILKLTKNEFWFTDNNEQEPTEFHLIKQ
ncbi:MAG: hypothetical protein PHP52_08295 [Bacteroidales bacterium]|nr:hypothetical protein [Bacteroidales bacterium]MDD4218137.1 hypothetical protein [Bacteroidales bacterium]MDY0140904.1 hypothetical protein [Bacteroidales bacterium]